MVWSYLDLLENIYPKFRIWDPPVVNFARPHIQTLTIDCDGRGTG
jgi:hypothetical protein